MSITIIKGPERYAPVGDDVTFKIESDNSNIQSFKVKLMDDDTSSIISQDKFGTTPETPRGTFIQLSRLLGNVVRWEINNDATRFIVSFKNP